jgi:hypothetical protein
MSSGCSELRERPLFILYIPSMISTHNTPVLPSPSLVNQRFIAVNSLCSHETYSHRHHTQAHSTSTDLPTKPCCPYSASINLVQLWNIDSPLPWRPCDLPRLELVNGVSSTHRIVMGVSADIISNRISHCLQSCSIEVRFCQKRSNVANCRNIEFCRFTVKMWGTEEGVHVEVQKIYGDAVSFNRDCRTILKPPKV